MTTPTARPAPSGGPDLTDEQLSRSHGHPVLVRVAAFLAGMAFG